MRKCDWTLAGLESLASIQNDLSYRFHRFEISRVCHIRHSRGYRPNGIKLKMNNKEDSKAYHNDGSSRRFVAHSGLEAQLPSQTIDLKQKKKQRVGLGTTLCRSTPSDKSDIEIKGAYFPTYACLLAFHFLLCPFYLTFLGRGLANALDLDLELISFPLPTKCRSIPALFNCQASNPASLSC